MCSEKKGKTREFKKIRVSTKLRNNNYKIGHNQLNDIHHMWYEFWDEWKRH